MASLPRGVNIVVLSGTVIKPVIIKKTEKGGSFCRFTLTTVEPILVNGKMSVQNHNCIAFDKIAELLDDNVTQGKYLTVQGRIRRSVNVSGGQRYFNVDIQVNSFVLMDEIKSGEIGEEVSDEQF